MNRTMPPGENSALFPAVDLKKQLQTLGDSLKMVEKKFIGEWLGTQLDAMHQQQETVYTENMRRKQKELSGLKERLSELRTQESRKRKAGENLEQELKKLEQEIENINKEASTLREQNQLITKEIAEKQTRNQKEKISLEAQDQAAKLQTQELEKSASFFTDRLGLSIKKVSGGRMQLVFTHIDYRNIARPFYCFVKIKDDRSYEVSECEPAIEDIEELIRKLNQTNNFKAFVLTIRKRFKQLV